MMAVPRCLLLAIGALVGLAAAKVKNVVFFVADDLRPQLNKSYGQDQMITPNLDKFAEEALVFDYAFTNFAICSASRNSFMTGRRPPQTRVWNFINDFRQGGLSANGNQGADWTTLPEYFKEQGYMTVGQGKLYHPGHPPNWDEPKSWSQDYSYVNPSNSACNAKHGKGNFCPDGKSDIDKFSDRNVTLSALNNLQLLAKGYHDAGTPFFFGLGLHYPHQSWHVPTNITEMYPNAQDMPIAQHQNAPIGSPDVAFTAELDGMPTLSLNESLPGLKSSCPTNVTGMIEYICPRPNNQTIPAFMQAQLRLGYYSAVTLTDIHFGMVMDELERTGLANETLVVVVADHGWQLGEGAEWGKHTNWERAVRVPLMMRAPWTSAGGQHTQTFFELVDLYKTVVAAAGLDPLGVQDDVDGIDQSSVLINPLETLKSEAYSQYSRCPGNRYWPKRTTGQPDWYMNNCESVPSYNISYMGYTLRDRQFRYTAWYAWNGSVCDAKWDEGPYATELYSHEGEPDQPLNFDAWDLENVVNQSIHAGRVKLMQNKLERQFRLANTSCPPDPVKPGPKPLPNHGLVLQYSNVGLDSCLCTNENCLKNKNAEYNYTEVGSQGYGVDAGSTGAVELLHWYNSTRHDNYVTTATSVPGYAAVSNDVPLGWILKSKPSDLAASDVVEMQVWYNSRTEDHMTASDTQRLAWAKTNGYVFVDTVGYAYAKPTSMSMAAMEHDL
eukprot:m.103166 g.103166  ORF g.103166 m.103166 type:complete len:723 (+) comp15214_c0_seq1:88-2256(+)